MIDRIWVSAIIYNRVIGQIRREPPECLRYDIKNISLGAVERYPPAIMPLDKWMVSVGEMP